MRLAEQLAEEELGEPAPVPPPVVPVVLRPALVGGQDLVKVIDGPVGRQRHQFRYRRSDSHDTEDALGMQDGRQQRNPAAAGYPDDHGTLDLARVHHRDGVRHELGLGIRLGRLRPVRTSVAPGVDGDDPEPAGEVGQLGLPRAGVNDRGDGREDHHRLTLAEHLITDLDAAAIDKALDVRIPGPHGASLGPG